MIIKYGWRLLLIAPLVLAFGVYVNNGYKYNKPICPDDFKDPKQEIASFTQWVKEFAEKYPNATNSDLSKARKDFYIKNNCTEALKRYDDYMAGNIDEDTKKLIEMVIKQEMAENKRVPVCPDEYENQEDYIKVAGEWLGNFYDKNPNTTKEEMLSARMNFLIENGCRDMSKID